MKPPKTALDDLRRLFTHTVTLRDIAEALISFDATQPASAVREELGQRGFDVVGVREHGIVTGYALRTELGDADLGRHRREFSESDLLADGEPLLAAFTALRERRQVFISVFGHAGGIVTRGDLQKAPVRLWLFGLVSLLETQILRLVRERYPADSWVPLLSAERVENARRLFAERRRRNEQNDLPECLQFGDKAAVFMKDRALVELSGFPSKRSLATFFNGVGNLRNALAHTAGIRHQQWPQQSALVFTIEALLAHLEKGSFPPAP
jgi:hypothetical protein